MTDGIGTKIAVPVAPTRIVLLHDRSDIAFIANLTALHLAV